MKYFISILLLALVAVQASPLYEVHASTYDVVDIQELENYISWSEIWKQIQSFVQQVKDAFNALTGNMKGIFDKIKQKIKDIIGVGSVSEIRDKLIAALKKMLGQVSAKVQACIDKQKDKITKLATETEVAFKKCATQAQGKLGTIEKETTDIKNAVSKLLSDALKDGFKCVAWPPTASKCLTDLFGKLKSKSTELMNKAKGIVDIAKNLLTDAGNCANQVTKDTTNKLKLVYNDVIKCAAA